VADYCAKLIIVALLVFLFTPTALVYSNSSTDEKDKPKDEVTVHGKTLQGRIIRLGPTGIEFTTIYGRGRLSISYEDIEKLVSQHKYLVFYGKDQLVRGRLFGIEDGQLLVGIDESTAQRVPLKEIETGVSEESYEESFWTRLRTNYRHWRGNLDLGLTYEEGAVDKKKIETGFNFRRRKKPTRFVLDFRYAFEVQESGDNPEVTTKDELSTFVLGEYDFKDPFFVFARPALEYDRPRNVDSRWFPAAGVGYRIVDKEDEQTYLQLPVGIGYVDEDFGELGTRSFVSWYVGLAGKYDFGGGVILAGGVLYMPSMDNPDEDWLFRGELNFTVPILDPLALKLRLTNVNDNNPTPEVGENKFTASLLFSLVF
jgi:hypothetical protein